MAVINISFVYPSVIIIFDHKITEPIFKTTVHIFRIWVYDFVYVKIVLKLPNPEGSKEAEGTEAEGTEAEETPVSQSVE